MFLLKKLMLLSLTAMIVATLSACTLGQTAEPTTAPVDVNAIMTSAAGTASVQLTQIAASAPVTSTATLPATTAPASETPTPGATDTEGPTSTEGPTGTQAPTNTPEPASISPSETPVVAGAPTNTPIASLTPIASGGGSTGPQCKNSQFDGDITIPDGTVMSPGEEFVKAWKVRNNGICAWTDGFYFAGWIGPNTMTDNTYYFREGNLVDVGEAKDIYINMIAPNKPGDYIAHWQMHDADGQPFGSDFTVAIKVVK